MNTCPLCGDTLSGEIEESATEGQVAEFLAGFRSCICGWEGYLASETEKRDKRNENISKRTKNASRFERSFANRCRRNGWIIVRGNILATYLLQHRLIRNSDVRQNLKSISKAISSAGYKKSLLEVFKEYRYDENTDNNVIGIYGLPDFIVLTQFNKFPLWVEVKFGSSKLNSNQRLMKRMLEDIGFKVFLYQGGRISIFDKRLHERY